MGNCGSSPGCDKCYNREGSMGCVSHVEVDTDIAGVGVLIAFLLSSLLTCGAILWGYLTDSLPLSTMSAVDEAIVLWLRKSRKTAPAHQNLLTREQRTQALTRFILALSDQQLVTGLALMIAAFTNTANITIFDMKLVDTFAWFSATTHLAALAVLQDYMYIHSSVRSFRVIGVFIFLIMFGIIQCFLSLTGNLRPGYEVNGLQCAFRHPCLAPSTYIRAVSLALITYGSISNLKKLYRKPSNQSIIWRPKFVNSSNFDLLCSIKQLNVDDARRKLPRVEEEMQMWLLSSLDLRQSFIQSFFTYHNSFLSKVPQFLLALSLALSRTFSLIGYQRAWSSPDSRRMAFGQVAALGLLILPGLAAVEVYNEAKHDASGPHHPLSNGFTRLDGQDQTTMSASRNCQSGSYHRGNVLAVRHSNNDGFISLDQSVRTAWPAAITISQPSLSTNLKDCNLFLFWIDVLLVVGLGLCLGFFAVQFTVMAIFLVFALKIGVPFVFEFSKTGYLLGLILNSYSQGGIRLTQLNLPHSIPDWTFGLNLTMATQTTPEASQSSNNTVNSQQYIPHDSSVEPDCGAPQRRDTEADIGISTNPPSPFRKVKTT